MAELKTRVDELKMENEYQLRLKDMNYNEKIKDLTDKFLQEIDSLKARNEVSECCGCKGCGSRTFNRKVTTFGQFPPPPPLQQNGPRLNSQRFFSNGDLFLCVLKSLFSCRHYKLIRRQKLLTMKMRYMTWWTGRTQNYKKLVSSHCVIHQEEGSLTPAHKSYSCESDSNASQGVIHASKAPDLK
jgi:hypothetical protein